LKATTEQLVSALRVLSVEIHSEDGVANAVVAEAAERLTLMANLVARHVQETKDDVEQMNTASQQMVAAAEKIRELRERIGRLENIISRASTAFFKDGSDKVAAVAMLMILDEAKEAKP
jgi:hypothetical protein